MSNAERRKTRRRPVLESFSLFVVVPKKGPLRLKVHDLSDGGMRFDVDAEGESPTDFQIREGENIDVQLYLNQTLFLPLRLRVVRVESAGAVRRLGAEFAEKSSPGYRAFLAFVQMLDGILDEARLSSGT